MPVIWNQLTVRLPIEDDRDGRGAGVSHNGVHHERLAIRRNHLSLSVLEADNAAHARGEQPKPRSKFDSRAV